MAKKDRESMKVDIGEAVGIVAAQSIGEPGTQMSLPYGEKVVVREAGEVKIVEIGAYIDALMDRLGSVSEGGHEVCDPGADVQAPSLNADEKMEWRRISAVSRHRAPGKLVRISLRSGRTITATPFHSFVVRKDNKIVPVAAERLAVGERLPVARRMRLDADALARVDVKPRIAEAVPYLTASNGMLYAYPREASRPLPEHLELDGELGWFLGIYIAEGSAARNYASISNTNEAVLEKVRAFARTRNFTVNEYENTNGFAPSRDLRINSTLLAQFVKKETGAGAHSKRVPEFAYSAGDEFVAGLLRGYFDGDGNVNAERGVLRFSSVSRELLDGIALLLARFGIFATKCGNAKCYTLCVSYRYAHAFLEIVGSDDPEKKRALETLASIQREVGYNMTDVIPGVGDALSVAARALGMPSRLVNNFTKRQKIGRSTLVKYLSLFDSVSGGSPLPVLEPLRKAAEGDVVWDEITRIEYAEPAHEFVYDFTVPGTETFMTFDGVVTHNTMRTFHYAGVAEQVPTGLPRLIEIVDVRREPKKPLMNIYLKKELRTPEKARAVAEEIEEVNLGKIANVRENFEKKEIEVRLDQKMMAYEGTAFDTVLKKLKSSEAGKAEQVGETAITIKPKAGSLKAIRRATERLADMHLKGVKGISRAIVVDEDGAELFIRTAGSNLEEVLKMPEVDAARVYTNNIKEIERVLGIEAARNSIIFEANQVLEMQRLDVDVRHLRLLADAMCMDGQVKSVGRHGLSGEKVSLLARAAFEETIKHLIKGAIKGEEDKLVGVTENIIVGQAVPVGTGIVTLSMPKGKK